MDYEFNNKSYFRKKLLDERKSFNRDLYYSSNEIIYKKLVDFLRTMAKNKIKIIGYYWPLQAEPDLSLLNPLDNFIFSLPIMKDVDMKFIKYLPGDYLEESSFSKLPQPVGNEEIIPDIVIVPGLAFSTSGYRLGFGKGHYDRYFARIRRIYETIAIGVCFHQKLFDYLPFDFRDQKLDYILTDKIIIRI